MMENVITTYVATVQTNGLLLEEYRVLTNAKKSVRSIERMKRSDKRLYKVL